MSPTQKVHVLAIAGAVFAWETGIRADEVAAGSFQLHYEVSADADCPNEEQFRAAVVSKLGFDPFVADRVGRASLPQVRVVLRSTRTAEIHLEDAPPRTLASATGDCRELSESAALTVVLVLEDAPGQRPNEAPPPPSQPPLGPAPAAPPVTQPVPPAATPKPPEAIPTSAVAGFLFSRLFIGAGFAPTLSWGPTIGGGAALENWRLAAEFSFAAPMVTGGGPVELRGTRVWGTILPCYAYELPRSALLKGDRSSAADLLAQHAQRFPTGQLRVERELLMQKLTSGQDRPDAP